MVTSFIFRPPRKGEFTLFVEFYVIPLASMPYHNFQITVDRHPP